MHKSGERKKYDPTMAIEDSQLVTAANAAEIC